MSFTVHAVNRLNAFRMAIVRHGDDMQFPTYPNSKIPNGDITLGTFSRAGVVSIGRGEFAYDA